MQNVNQTDYKNRLTYVKQLKSLPDNINALCKDNNLLVLDCLLDLISKEDKFILNLCEPIIYNLCTKLKSKIQFFIKKQFKFNQVLTYEILCTFFTNRNSKLVCSLLGIIIELAEESVEEVLLVNLGLLFEHADSEVKKWAVKLCGVINRKCSVVEYVKDIKPILMKEVQKEICKNEEKKDFEKEIQTNEKIVEEKKKLEEKKSEIKNNTVNSEIKNKKVEEKLKKSESFVGMGDSFLEKFPFLKEKKWNIRYEEIKNNLPELKQANQNDLVTFLSNSSETISQINALFLEIFPVNFTNEFFIFISKRITDLKLHPLIKEKVIKNDSVFDLLFEHAKQKKGKIFASTLKLFNILVPEKMSINKLEEYLENCNVTALLEKEAIKESKKILEIHSKNKEEVTVKEKKNEDFINESLIYKDYVCQSNKSFQDDLILEEKEIQEENKDISLLECEKSLSQLNINFISEEREKNGKNIESFLKKEEINYLNETDLSQLSPKIIEKFSDFILKIIKERNLSIDFYLLALLKEKYIFSEYEIKEIIDLLVLRNDFNNLIKLDRHYPVSKIMLLLENDLIYFSKVLIHFIKKYKFYSGNIFNLYSVIKEMNDYESLKILLEIFPNLLSITPKKKRVQIDKVKECDFIEASFVEEIILEEKNTNQDISFSLLSDKTQEEIKILEEEFYSNDDFLQANSLITQMIQNENTITKIKETLSNVRLIKELNYKTLLNLHNKLIKEINEIKEVKEILLLLCKHSKQSSILLVYFDLLPDNSSLILKLLKKFSNRITFLEKDGYFVIKEFYEKNPMISLDKPEVDKVLKEILKKNECI